MVIIKLIFIKLLNKYENGFLCNFNNTRLFIYQNLDIQYS